MIKAHNIDVVVAGRRILTAKALSFPSSSINVVLGPNGSGKSTLLKVLCGLQKTQGSTLKVQAADLDSIALNERAKLISWLPQTCSVSFDFTAMDLVLMGRYPWHLGIPTALDRKCCNDVLDDLAIGSLKNKPVSEMSGGERQKALLARALVGDHAYIFMDEPDVYLDTPSTHRLLELLAKRADKGQTIILSLHDINLAAYYGTHLTLLTDGQVVAHGEKSVTLNVGNLKKTYGVPVHEHSLPDGKKMFDLLPGH